MILLTREKIIRLNYRHIQESGGLYVAPDNLRNAGSLEWVLDAIRYPLFGIEQYPTLAEKAAMLAWVIITEHVFHDGCKRTGMSALDILVRLNGFRLDATDDEIVQVALQIAGGDVAHALTREEFVQWVRDKLVYNQFV